MESIPSAPKISTMTSVLSSLSNRFSEFRRYIAESIQHFIRHISCVKTSHKAPPTQVAVASGIAKSSAVDANKDVKQVKSVGHSSEFHAVDSFEYVALETINDLQSPPVLVKDHPGLENQEVLMTSNEQHESLFHHRRVFLCADL